MLTKQLMVRAYPTIKKMAAATRQYGKINFSGHTPDATFNLSPLGHILDPAHTFVGQHDVRAKDRERLVRALQDKRVQKMIDTMITHEFPMSEADKAFETQVSKKCGKIYLYPQK